MDILDVLLLCFQTGLLQHFLRLEQQFDLIVVSWVLHHMPDLDATLAMFYHHLRENGQVLIADFVKTDTNHHGFDLAELENKLIQQVFSSVHSQIQKITALVSE